MKLLDTSVLVEIDRGKNKEKIQKLEKEGGHGISQVTVTEMFQGIEYQHSKEGEKYKKARDQLERLLSRFEVFEINRSISIKTAKIRAELVNKGKTVNDLHDSYIAATAIRNDLELLTKNPKHFENIEDLTFIDWRKY